MWTWFTGDVVHRQLYRDRQCRDATCRVSTIHQVTIDGTVVSGSGSRVVDKMYHILVVFGLVFLLMGCQGGEAAGSDTLTVSAASSLTVAFEEIGEAFTQEHGTTIAFNFASSGQLAQQIEEGAPVDVFASANVDYVDELAAQDLIVPDSQHVYARGRLTVWTQSGSQVGVTRIEQLTEPAVKTIAIANPAVAPYGRAAREALQAAGIWEAVQDKLVIGDNVRQAFQYGETGNVDVVLAPLSLSVQSDGRWELVPADMHAPIDHALAIVHTAPNPDGARAFVAFLMGPTGHALLEKHGLEPPVEDSGG